MFRGLIVLGLFSLFVVCMPALSLAADDLDAAEEMSIAYPAIIDYEAEGMTRSGREAMDYEMEAFDGGGTKKRRRIWRWLCRKRGCCGSASPSATCGKWWFKRCERVCGPQ